MKPQILIDGYNLIFDIPELKNLVRQDLEKAREKLIGILATSSHGTKADVTVVFDGSGVSAQSSVKRSTVRVLFSKPPEKADPVLKRMMEKRSAGVQMTVVTSDAEIARFARLCGVKVCSSSEYARGFNARQSEIPDRPSETMSRKEVEEWLLLFKKRGSADGIAD